MTSSAIQSDTPRPGDSYVQSFARGLEVIRSFSAQAPRQTLSEVAAATGLTRAGARRILLTLQTLGYVESEGKVFGLTPRILDLGFAYLSSMPIWDLAEPVMQALVDQVHESSSAAVLEGDDILYVLRVHTQKIMSISLGVGSRLPAYCTSMGRVLLAGLDDEALRQRIKKMKLTQRTKRTVIDPVQLQKLVLQTRQQGWSLVDQELEEGLISIAAPVFDRMGRTVAALNVSGQANRTSAAVVRQTMLPPLLQAAQQISRLVAGAGR